MHRFSLRAGHNASIRLAASEYYNEIEDTIIDGDE